MALEALTSGLSVIMLEAGDYVGDRSYDSILEESETALIRDDKGIWVPNGYPWTVKCVGGGSMFFGGAAFRFRDVDFDAERYLGDGDLPVKWLVTQQEMDPYYREIEVAIGVAGGGAIEDPRVPGAHSVLQPPHPVSRTGLALSAGADKMGWTTYRTPLAIPTLATADGGYCHRDAPCMDRRCPWGAKGDAVRVFLSRAIVDPNFQLMTKTWASHLERSSAHAVGCVVYERHLPNGDIESGRVFAKTVVLAANAIQSAAILLRSADSVEPNGMGNSKDLVGRGLCMKLSLNVEGYLSNNVAPGMPTSDGPFSTVAFTDSYVHANAPGGLGGLIYENRHPYRVPMADPEQVLQVECLAADQPQMSNRVSLSSRRDQLGHPLLIIDYRIHPRDSARLAWLGQQANGLLRAAGADHVRTLPTGFEGGSGHLHGTLRSGSDPKTSVTDKVGRLHAMDNVFVADGSVFPFPGGVSPTLTIAANALRIAREGIVPFAIATK